MGTVHFLNQRAKAWHEARGVTETRANTIARAVEIAHAPVYAVTEPALWEGTRYLTTDALAALQNVGGYGPESVTAVASIPEGATLIVASEILHEILHATLPFNL